jgi:hypothetical protein
VSLIPRHYGYFEEEIKVYNTHSRDPALRVKVCLFVEEKLVHLDMGASAAEPAKAAVSDSAASAAPLDFGCVYLRPREQDETTVGEDTASEGKAKEKEKEREKEKVVEREREKVERAESEESVEYDAEDEIDEVYSETSTDGPELEINSSSDVSDSGVRWKTVVVENVSHSDLLLRARTEFDLGVMWRQHSDDGQTDDQQQLLPIPTTHDQGEKGGTTKDQLLKPGQKARLLVSMPLPTHKTLLQHVTTSQAHTRPQRLVNSLLQGQRVDVLGMSVPLSPVMVTSRLKLIYVRACVLKATCSWSAMCAASSLADGRRTPCSAAVSSPSRRPTPFLWRVCILRRSSWTPSRTYVPPQ